MEPVGAARFELAIRPAAPEPAKAIVPRQAAGVLAPTVIVEEEPAVSTAQPFAVEGRTDNLIDHLMLAEFVDPPVTAMCSHWQAKMAVFAGRPSAAINSRPARLNFQASSVVAVLRRNPNQEVARSIVSCSRVGENFARQDAARWAPKAVRNCRLPRMDSSRLQSQESSAYHWSRHLMNVQNSVDRLTLHL